MVTKVTAVNIQDKVTTGDKAATLINDNKRAINQVIDAKEESLGNPVNSGRLLSSTADGVRKWVDVGRSRTFQSVVDAVNYVTVNPNTLDQVTTVSYRNKVECTSLGIDYPDGNGGEYTVVEGESLLAGLVIAAGVKQLKLITQKINKPLDTIADLRNFRPTVGGQTVELLGHTLAGIGGGQFYYDPDDTTSADNDGTVIVTSSGERWKRKMDGYVTPEMFGAGVELNDTAGCQAAAEYSAMNSMVFFPAKAREYNLDSQMIFPQVYGEPIIIFGNMAKFKVGGSYPISEIDNSVFHIKPNNGPILVRDIRVDGNNRSLGYTQDTHSINAVSVNNTGTASSNVVVENIEAEDMPSAVVSVFDATNLTIKGCKGQLINGHGIFFKRCFNVSIDNNSLSGIGVIGGATYGGIGILGTANKKVSLKGNFIKEFSDTGSKMEGCLDVIYSNNIVHDCGKDGIKVQAHPEQTEVPYRAVIENNIVKDLYPTRPDGSTCIQVSDTKYVTVTGNVVANDFSVTGSSRYGIRTFNHVNGTLGQAGFVLVNGNNVGNCSDDLAPLASISVIGVAGGGHTQTINNNICYSGIVGGDGFGPVTINGNIVGASDPSTSALPNLNGITSYSKTSVIVANTIRGFPVGVSVAPSAPTDDIWSAVVTGNLLENITLRQFDFGGGAGSLDLLLGDNVCTNFVQSSDAAIRLRVAATDFRTVSIRGNTFKGTYRTLCEFYQYTSGVIGSYVVTDNVEETDHASYFASNFVNKCKRVLGDYAKSSLAPTSDKSYKRGDLVYNVAPASGRPVGYQCVNASTQSWLSIGTLL